MTLMIILGIIWIASGKETSTPITFANLIPDFSLDTIAFFQTILFSLVGIEVVAVHRKDVINPERTYKIALTVARVLIFFSLTFSTMALVVIVPHAQLISSVVGLIQVFQIFFDAYNMPIFVYFIGGSVILGTVGVASSWIIGLTRCLYTTLRDSDYAGHLKWLLIKNKFDIPYRILFVQALVFTCLLSLLIFLPSVEYAYWLLTTLTTQYTCIYYIIIFIAVLRLRMQRLGYLDFMNVIGPALAILMCVFGFVVGFFPTTMNQGIVLPFEFELVGGLVVFAIPAIIVLILPKKNVGKDSLENINEGLFSTDTSEGKQKVSF